MQNTSRSRKRRSYVFESVEPRILLSTIVWTNRGNDGFWAYGAANAHRARALVDQAISAWEAAIVSFNYQVNPNNQSVPAATQFNVSISAADITGVPNIPANAAAFAQHSGNDFDWQGKPIHATITMGLDGAGAGWYFSAPNDNSAYANPVDAYAADGGNNFDFLSTVEHELGHAVGFDASPQAQITPQLYDSGLTDPTDPQNGHLYLVSGYGATIVFTDLNTEGLHVYGGASVQGFNTQPHDLMNPSTPIGQRKSISSFDVSVLADTYGYTVATPPVLNTLAATFDPNSSTLNINGSFSNDTITVTTDGNGNYVVTGDGILNQSFPAASVQHIHAVVYNGNNLVVISNTVTANASITGGAGDDTLVGGSGADTITDFTGNNVLQGGPGNDTIHGGTGNDYLIGGAGNDSLQGQYTTGSGGNDTLWGGWGDDTLAAGIGNDLLTGRAGNDYIFANNGFSDTIYGGLGNDTVQLDENNLDSMPNNDVEQSFAVSTILYS